MIVVDQRVTIVPVTAFSTLVNRLVSTFKLVIVEVAETSELVFRLVVVALVNVALVLFKLVNVPVVPVI